MGAPLAPIPDCLQVFMEGWVDNTDVYKWGNVLHFGYSGTAPSNATCATLASHVSTTWGTDMAPECPAPTQLVKVTVTDLSSASAGEGAWLGSIAGTRGDDSIAANGAVLISYPSATRYRGGHPRTYLYCLGNADFNGAAHWSNAGALEVQTHWQSFLNGIVGYTTGGTTVSSFGFARYHGRYLANGGPPHYYLTAPFFTAIPPSLAVANTEIASQRRRVGRRRA